MGNLDNSQSASGFLMKVETGAISWASKLQNFITLSTTEAKFVTLIFAANHMAKEPFW